MGAETVAVKSQPERSGARLAFTSLSATFATAWLAKERGYFKDYGLDVDLIYTRTVTGVQALVAGEIQFLYTGGPNVMVARRAGADSTMIASTNHYNPYVIASRPDIIDARQLVGKRLAVNRLADTSHLSAMFALKELGIDPSSVVFTQVGSTPERFVALHSKGVEAAMIDHSFVNAARKLGMNILVNLDERKSPYANSCIAVSTGFMKSNPQTVEAFMRAFVKGNAYVRAGSPEKVIAVMAKYMRLSADDETVRDNYTAFTKRNPKYPLMQREGVAFILQMYGQLDKTWLNWQPEQFYDNFLMEKLKKEGFLDKVYNELH